MSKPRYRYDRVPGVWVLREWWMHPTFPQFAFPPRDPITVGY